MEDFRSERLRQQAGADETDAITGEHSREQIAPGAMASRVPEMSGEELLETYEELVHDITAKMHDQCRSRVGADVSYENLFAYAVAGLLEAKRSFEPEQGSAFSTYAYYRIRGAILDGVRSEAWGPRRTQRLTAWRATNEEARARHEIAEETPPAKTLAGSLAGIKSTVYDAYAIQFLYDEHLETRFAHEELPSDAAEDRQVRKTIDTALKELSVREREVILRYHVNGETMAEIADSFGVTTSWVSRLNSQALTALRELLQDKGLM